MSRRLSEAPVVPDLPRTGRAEFSETMLRALLPCVVGVRVALSDEARRLDIEVELRAYYAHDDASERLMMSRRLLRQVGVSMKGVVFTEFLEMVEGRYSVDMVDDILDDANLTSGGTYTAVGTYDHREMVSLVLALSKRTDVPAPDLLRAFGEHLFGRFVANYPGFFAKTSDAFTFLAGLDEIIHAEVRKLYPDAELPRFDVESRDEHRLVLLYTSTRHFEDLAEGLLRGCVAHFGGAEVISRELIGSDDARRERFTVTRG